MSKFMKAAAVTAGVAGLVALGEAAQVHSADKLNTKREAAIVRCAPHLGDKALTAANVPERCKDLVTDYQDGIAHQRSIELGAIPIGAMVIEAVGLVGALTESRRKEVEPTVRTQPLGQSI